jgi:hypothetical protein
LESRPFLVDAAPFLCAMGSVLCGCGRLGQLAEMSVTLTWVYFWRCPCRFR